MGDNYRDFTELDVWKLAHEFRIKIYELTKFINNDEKYNVTSQIRRSACSVGANIAEGHGRYHFQENIQFCRQARGSLAETRDWLIFVRDAKLSSNASLIDMCMELSLKIAPKLNGYISYLKNQKSIN